ncbi:MAG: pyridoxal-phosphate dependent enzyme [Acidobacteria bacterium]|nr:pyridoxal-phosphate dependent enzyme [Acidobacteriota bacterium]
MPPTVLDIFRARRRLRPWLQPTPVRESGWLSSRCDHRALLKLESLNLTSSFKIRGAFNALLHLVEAHRVPTARPMVVTASAGNHGRAMARAAAQLGLRVVVFTPANAPLAKRAAIRRDGAELHDEAPDYDAAERLAHAFAREAGGVFISPYNHPDVIAGAGTVGLEIVEACPDVATVVVPLGGGGLASGVGLAIRAAAPAARVVGVEAEASTPFTASLARGAITTIEPKETLADGLAGNLEAGTITFPLVQQVVDEVVTVSEDDLRAAMRALAAEEHLMVEGSAAVAVAALASGSLAAAVGPAVAIVSGANIDLATLVAAVGAPVAH